MGRLVTLFDITLAIGFLESVKKLGLLKKDDTSIRDIWQEYDSELIQEIIREIEDGESIFSKIKESSL